MSARTSSSTSRVTSCLLSDQARHRTPPPHRPPAYSSTTSSRCSSASRSTARAARARASDAVSPRVMITATQRSAARPPRAARTSSRTTTPLPAGRSTGPSVEHHVGAPEAVVAAQGTGGADDVLAQHFDAAVGHQDVLVDGAAPGRGRGGPAAGQGRRRRARREALGKHLDDVHVACVERAGRRLAGQPRVDLDDARHGVGGHHGFDVHDAAQTPRLVLQAGHGRRLEPADRPGETAGGLVEGRERGRRDDVGAAALRRWVEGRPPAGATTRLQSQTRSNSSQVGASVTVSPPNETMSTDSDGPATNSSTTAVAPCAARRARARASSGSDQTISTPALPLPTLGLTTAGKPHGGQARGRGTSSAVEELVGAQLGLRHGVGVEVEQERHAETGHERGEPGERVVVFAGRQHGVARQATRRGRAPDRRSRRRRGRRRPGRPPAAPAAGRSARPRSRPRPPGRRPRCPAACRRRRRVSRLSGRRRSPALAGGGHPGGVLGRRGHAAGRSRRGARRPPARCAGPRRCRAPTATRRPGRCAAARAR